MVNQFNEQTDKQNEQTEILTKKKNKNNNNDNNNRISSACKNDAKKIKWPHQVALFTRTLNVLG